MKLQNFMVVFVIIILPIIIVTSYYMSLQIDTINMQTSYNSKLLDSTKEAIEAYEINTVEWNSKYDAVSDSKRRSIMASINSFTTSFSNSIGVGGANKENILSYIPAIAYTLYDGYYIYSPAETKVVATDGNGSTLRDEDKKVIYLTSGGGQTTDEKNADTEYKHILKPFSAYSKQYGDIIINYTLDNYIKVYKEVDGKYALREGYLVKGVSIGTDKSVENIKYKGKSVEKEILSENVYIKNEGVKECKYIYSTDRTKIYIESATNKAFVLDHDNKKVYLDSLMNKTYKKVLVPTEEKKSYTEVYQDLSHGKWYTKINKDGRLTEENLNIINNISNFGIEDSIEYDYSAINYCVESYMFSNWFKEEVKGIDILKDFLNSDPEEEESEFSQERKEVIKEELINSLNQAITSYSRNSEGEYQLPKLLETDWNHILNNVAIITFLQDIPIGVKKYNNYAIATSTRNKDFVDPDEIYLINSEDEYYHRPYCEELEENLSIIGYRNVDYVLKDYDDTSDNSKKYYYLHNNQYKASQECYNCIIQRDLYNESTGTKLEKQQKAYYTALARERYIATEAETKLYSQSLINIEFASGAVVNETIQLYEGETISLSEIIVKDELGQIINDITWNISNEEIAYMLDGVIYLKKEGDAHLIATRNDNNAIGTIGIKVKKSTIDPIVGDDEIKAGEIKEYVVEWKTGYGLGNVNFEWTSSDTTTGEIVEHDEEGLGEKNGYKSTVKVRGVSDGKFNITAKVYISNIRTLEETKEIESKVEIENIATEPGVWDTYIYGGVNPSTDIAIKVRTTGLVKNVQKFIEDKVELTGYDNNIVTIGSYKDFVQNGNEISFKVNVSGKAEGETKIKAKEKEGTKEAECAIKINSIIKQIKIEPNSWTAYIGGIQETDQNTKPKTQIKVSIETFVQISNAQEFVKDITLVVNNANIIEVKDLYGNITQTGNVVTFTATIVAKAKGTTNITAKAQTYNKESNKYSVEIKSAGTGSSTDPYIIYYIEDLVDLSNKVLGAKNNGIEVKNSGNTYSGKYFKLGRTLDFTVNEHYRNYQDTVTYSGYNGSTAGVTIKEALTSESFRGLAPIGSGTRYDLDIYLYFSGIFDGDNKKIINLRIIEKFHDQGSSTEIALFGSVKNATIKNLTLENIYYGDKATPTTHSYADYGGIVARFNESCTIDNCHVSGYIGSGTNSNISRSIGGIACREEHSNKTDKITIKNCSSNIIVSATETEWTNSSFGGIFAGHWGTYATLTSNLREEEKADNKCIVDISNCTSDGTVNWNEDGGVVGGIAGNISSGTIYNCTNNMQITLNSDRSYLGGIVGKKNSSNKLTISECKSNGNLSSTGSSGNKEATTRCTGGIVGIATNCDIKNCIVNANISYSDSDNEGKGFIGGILGYDRGAAYNYTSYFSKKKVVITYYGFKRAVITGIKSNSVSFSNNTFGSNYRLTTTTTRKGELLGYPQVNLQVIEPATTLSSYTSADKAENATDFNERGIHTRTGIVYE